MVNKNNLCILGVVLMMFVAACGATGSNEKAGAASPQVWCDEGNACILKDYEEITPQMLGNTVNSMYCSNRGVSTIALKWESDADGTKVTRMALVCPS
jgi:hypothetical protein